MAIGQVMIHVKFPKLNLEKLQVCVTDFNDHPPKFVSPPKNFTIRVPENEQVRVRVMFVKMMTMTVEMRRMRIWSSFQYWKRNL